PVVELAGQRLAQLVGGIGRQDPGMKCDGQIEPDADAQGDARAHADRLPSCRPSGVPHPNPLFRLGSTATPPPAGNPTPTERIGCPTARGRPLPFAASLLPSPGTLAAGLDVARSRSSGRQRSGILMTRLSQRPAAAWIALGV